MFHPRFLHLLPFLLLLLIPSHITAQTPSISLCSNDVGNYTAGSTYRKNLNNIIHSISSSDSASGFYNLSLGRGPNRVNAIGLCRGDIRPTRCRDCIDNCPLGLLKACPNQKQAIVHCELCMFRYSNRSIYALLDPDPVTFSMWNAANESDPARFNAALGTLLTRLRTAASASGGSSSLRKFASGKESKGNVTVYGLLQCTPDLSPQLCDDCLAGAIGEGMYDRRGRIGGRVMKPNCNLRFEIYKFYEDTVEPPSQMAPTPAPVPATPPDTPISAPPTISPPMTATPPMTTAPPITSPPPLPVTSPPPFPQRGVGHKNTRRIIDPLVLVISIAIL